MFYKKSIVLKPSCSLQTDGRTDGRTEGRTEGWTDVWTDMTKLKVAFRNFTKAPDNYLFGLSG